MRKKVRKEARAVPAMHPPLPDAAADGARAITTAIEKNRGLTPHRNKVGAKPSGSTRRMFEPASCLHVLFVSKSACLLDTSNCPCLCPGAHAGCLPHLDVRRLQEFLSRSYP